MEQINYCPILKAKKIKADGTCPLHIRIKVGSSITEISLKYSVTKDDWDAVRKRVKPRNPNAALINAAIISHENNIVQIGADLRLTGQVITAQVLKMRISGGNNNMTLLSLFFKHNTDVKARIGNDFSIATLRKYELTKMKLEQFIQSKYLVDDLQIRELKYGFILDFETFLKSTQKLAHNSAIKHIKNLKKIVRLAVQLDYIEKHPFDAFKCSVAEVNRNCLTKDELRRLIEKGSLNSRLEVIRDVFVFCCYTGLSYADVAKLNRDHINGDGKDELRVIIIPRTKTKSNCRIPLLPVAEAILKKYIPFTKADKLKRLLPVNSNQKFNEYLKELATLCDINKTLTVHIARHTMACTVTLENGISLEVVKTILGHKNIRTTQLYSKMTDIRLHAEMNTLILKTFSNKNSNPTLCK
ncbi:MAG TPA: site-specific integrase [Sediminibacterium sp.]|uniref:site-specific integrase n=1 Tax=Sediminibacterium sp. TaxID=1917865 RepID=UPI0008D053EC|nr:site-specific integrase [Sediminibacterium sp.]OHC85632.1 MAG: hypothetical protein A2472_07720 [Sphingobacteriia bacterium RIFOXYC2_FULL_35_18]OHC89295.1 MAG: hypothetical protein A2546_07145 [Sphingobacteriia bacterium RIFOXYD2_FULL_35_12]HLD52728.1 site-specific integrase [Sediminibacterium sp.]